jgi:hypothetical protein
MATARHKRPKSSTAAALRKLATSKSLFQITITDRHGKKRQGPILPALETHGYIEEFNRMVDVTGGKIEADPVVAVPAPPAKRRAALREIAAFV